MICLSMLLGFSMLHGSFFVVSNPHCPMSRPRRFFRAAGSFGAATALALTAATNPFFEGAVEGLVGGVSGA
jgi:hypothetical protein